MSATTRTDTARCARCAHERDDHRHYRRGSDCAHCNCPRWARGWLGRIAVWAGGVLGALVILVGLALIIGSGLYRK